MEYSSEKKIKIDMDRVREYADRKNMNLVELNAEIGMSRSYIQTMNGNGGLHPHTVKLIALTLGVSEDDILPQKNANIAAAVNSNDMAAIRTEIEILGKRVASIDQTLGEMSSLLVQLNKLANETLAQAKINADEISGIKNKSVEINSGVNIIKGTLRAFKEASKK